jgi:hypothetical protein
MESPDGGKARIDTFRLVHFFKAPPPSKPPPWRS